MRNFNLIATKPEYSCHWSQRRQHFLNGSWEKRAWNLGLKNPLSPQLYFGRALFDSYYML